MDITSQRLPQDLDVGSSIRRRAARLKLSARALESASQIVAEAGLQDKDAMTRLRKEWFNDLMADPSDDDYAAAIGDPDAHFLSWITLRSRLPYHVTYRAVDKAGRRCGPDLALLMVKVRWKQEVAWAQRARSSRDEVQAVLAALFIAEARRDPGKVFVSLTEEAASATATDRFYADHPNHELTAEEIRNGFGDEAWRPVWQRYAERQFAPLLEKLSDVKLGALAKKARQDEQHEKRRMAIEQTTGYLERWPLSRRISLLHLGLKEHLSSNDVVNAERAYILALRRGTVELPASGQAVDTAFFDWMRGSDFPIDAPNEDQTAERLDAVRFLGSRWIDHLPEDLIDIGARSRVAFSEWRKQVLTGVRPPPLDPVADYGMFLLESGADDL